MNSQEEIVQLAPDSASLTLDEIFKANNRRLTEAFFESIHPPEDLYIDEWADRYRVLPEEASSEPGPWRTSRTPYLKEIMRCLSPQDPCDQVAIMAGSQLGKTEVDLNFILYIMHHKPGSMLYVQGTIEVAERFSIQRLAPSIAACKVLEDKIGEQKSRDTSKAKLMKTFPGGVLFIGGANSAPSLRSTPLPYFAADEIDTFPDDVGGEGDPVKLGEKRTSNFPKRKRYYSSTPNTRESSRIEPLFEGGDQRRYHVPCPFCNKKQTIKWSNIVWKYEDPSTVTLECEHCASHIPERYKTWMLENGEWIAGNKEGGYPSFHINALYSPIGWYSWAKAVSDFLEAKRELSKQKLKVFVNTVLAETWTESGKSIEFSVLAQHKTHYSAEVPAGALILTAGVDVQDDRIECEILGWGRGLETWSIEYRILMGDTEDDFVWNQLDDVLNKFWTHESGKQMNVAAAGIDSGHRAHRVYLYCLQREFRRFFPVKGKGGWGNGLILRPTNRNKDGVYLFTAWVDEIKSKVFSHLSIEKEGPGYCHFPDNEQYNDHYFQMLTAERLRHKMTNGRQIPTWELLPGRRNEALDCRNYNVAAFNIIDPNFDEIELRGPVVVPTKKQTRRTGTISRGEAV